MIKPKELKHLKNQIKLKEDLIRNHQAKKSEIEVRINELYTEIRDIRTVLEEERKRKAIETATHTAREFISHGMSMRPDNKVFLKETEKYWIDVIYGTRFPKKEDRTKSGYRCGGDTWNPCWLENIEPIIKEDK